MMSAGNDISHVSPEEIAAFLDGRLSPEEREALLRHVSSCDPCRQDLISARRLVKSHHRFRKGLGIGAMAAAALLVLTIPLVIQRSPGRPIFRSSEPTALEVRPRIEAVGPEDVSQVAEGEVRFRWRSAGEGVLYELTLLDEHGATLWTLSTRDTTAAPGAEVSLDPGRRYFWYVDALLEGGETATSGLMEFTTR